MANQNTVGQKLKDIKNRINSCYLTTLLIVYVMLIIIRTQIFLGQNNRTKNYRDKYEDTKMTGQKSNGKKRRDRNLRSKNDSY